MQRGFGVAPDLSAAATAYEKACDAGDKTGCNQLAWLYQHGRGVSTDLERAVELYEKACAAESPHACLNLGRLQRERANAQPEKARAALSRACELHASPACRLLAEMLSTGEGGEQDLDTARARLYQSCTVDGDTVACGLLVRLDRQ
jgi:hypothetical protein